MSQARALSAAVWLALAIAGGAAAAAIPASVPGVDAPELARLGPFSVGIRTLHLKPARADERALDLELWYPARTGRAAPPVVYGGTLTPEHPSDQPVRFSVPGLAVRDAAAVDGPFPLVVLSHGHSGTPQAMAWLAENLASKGYVVAGPYHRDPPLTDAAQFAVPLAWRPLDQAFVARALQAMARDPASDLAGMIDPDRLALVGYSMGGYGAVTLAAGGLDPQGVAAAAQTRGVPRLVGLKAVAAISPWGGQARYAVWSKEQLAAIRTPMMLIVGDRDDVVGYQDGVRSIYEASVAAPRYLLVFQEAGHSIGMGPASPETYASLWGLDYFEDPVWRKDRVIAISLHFLTAFLDRYVKGETDLDSYLDVAVAKGDDAVWPPGAGPAAYDAKSPGAGPITVWKGFTRRGVTGLQLLHAAPGPSRRDP